MMKKTSGAISTIGNFAVGLLALTSVAGHGSARAQSADVVLCDRVAADPTDPDKPADVAGTTAIAPSDVMTAIKFCKIAAAASRRGLYELGRAYAANRQMPEAEAAYRKAADKGSTAAMVELGVLYATGSGVAQNQDQARALFERAAQAGNARGAANLMTLSNSADTPPDPVKARAMLAIAAQSNSADAQYQLGVMDADGIGGPQDDVAARALFEKAAAQNHPGALERMGEFEQSGRGGPQDKEAAKAYYEKAAALGNEDAKAALKKLECPLMIRDKGGNLVSYLCF
jgi:uncharacterized protein